MGNDVERFMEQLGAEVSRLIDERIRGSVLAVTAKVGTTAILGFSPFRNFTSINGDTITNGEAAVWINVETTANNNYTWCPVRRGVTLAEGDYVRVIRDSMESDTWYVDTKL